MINRAAKRILVAGCRGQVGTELLARCVGRSLDFVGLDLPDLDISDEASVQHGVQTVAPDLIINAAAYTAVDKAESELDLARAVNASGPRNLARAAAKANIPLFHISTDYVFDGSKKGPYVEDDIVTPLGVYGLTKAEGDEAIRTNLHAHIILRTAWVYSPFGGNFVKTMLRLAADREELNVVNDQHGCPTAAGDIADTLLTIAEEYFTTPASMEPKWGTYHFCNGPATTWCQLARAIMSGVAARGESAIPVHAITTKDYPTPAKRPANSSLDCSKIAGAFSIKPRNWHEALDETLDQLIADQVNGDTRS